jgi:hypothetical protein
MSNNQRRFSGATAEEAIAAARAALGPDARIVAAERVTKPGIFGRKRHVVVTAEAVVPVRPSEFARELSAQLAQEPREEDLDVLREAYRDARVEAPQVVVAAERRRPAVVVGQGGEVRPAGSLRRPVWSLGTDVSGAAVRAMIDDRAKSLVVDLGGPGDDVVVDVSGASAERAEPPEGARLIAVCAPSVAYPLAAFDAVADRVGIGEDQRFVLARRRREIPAGLRSAADRVARAVARGGTRIGVLVDPDQLALLRGSFLAPMTFVVAAVDGTEAEEALERELAPCGPIDALYCVRSERAAAVLGLGVLA